MTPGPHGTQSQLAAMWRRLYRDVQAMIDASIVRVLGQSWRGGKLDGASVGGTLPASTIPSHHTTHQAGGTDALTALDAAIITTGTLERAHGGTGIDSSSVLDGEVLIGKTSDHTWARTTLTAGTGVTIASGAHSVTINAVGGSGGVGTVTSVDVAVPAPLSSAGGPITSSGTITLSWASGQTANRVLASPDGTTGAVSLRALTSGDIPSLPASQITSGQLSGARGGTGVDAGACTDGQLLIGQSSDHSLGLATLTAGSNMTITNAGHAITLAASGGGGGQAVEQLAYTLTSDTSVNGSNAAFVDFITNQSFTVDLSTSTVEILVECSILVNISTGSQINQLRVVIDSAGTPINRQVCGGITDPNGHAILSGGTTVVTGLSVGSHTVKLQALINGGALNPTFTCNPSTLPNLYFLRIIVLEFE